MFKFSRSLKVEKISYPDHNPMNGLKEMKNKAVLIIDDDYVNFLYFKELLTGVTQNILRSISLTQALSMMTENNFSLIILSASLPENFNNFALRYIKLKFPEIPVISLMDSHNRYMEADLLRAGSDLCVSRHTDQDHFIEAFFEVLESHEDAR